MKAHYRTKSGRITFEVEGQTPKELFRSIADVQELFEADSMCGCCSSDNVVFRVRMAEDNEFYELYCKQCTASLGFHQRKTGGRLYLKWEERTGNNRGWKVWRGRQTDGEAVEQERSF